jgi:cell division transport system ATP-binding protein
MVTHDVDIVNTLRKRTVALDEGHIVADLVDGGYHGHE